MKKAIVLDANILFRAILRTKVPEQLLQYQSQVNFFTPAYCYNELRKYIPHIAEKKKLPLEPFQVAIAELQKVVIPFGDEIYSYREKEAKNRIRQRDINDWPVVALALTLDCPVWTEDQDFFGTGIPIWNSQNVEIFLSGEDV